MRLRCQRWRSAGHAVLLGLALASLSSGCAPSPAPPVTERVRPTEGPIGTAVTPVAALLSATPSPAATSGGIVLVQISTATPGATGSNAAASGSPPPTQAPAAAATAPPVTVTAATSGSPAAQQAPQQIASPGRVTSVRLSSSASVHLPCPDPRVVIGVAPAPDASEMTVYCQSVDASEVPPPGQIVGGMVFRVFTDRASDLTLPSVGTVGIAYGDTAIESEREADLVLGHLDGTAWVPVPNQQVDAPLDYVSGPVVELGAYALYLR